MNTLYFECQMGAAGDMLMAALLELFDDPQKIVQELNGLGLQGVEYRAESAESCGIGGTRMRVFVHGVEEVCEDVLVHDHHHDEESHCHCHHDEESHGHHHDEESHCHHHGDGEHDHCHHHGEGHAHHHASLADIRAIVSGLSVSAEVRTDILSVYGILAEAESHAHGVPVEEVHFHEVGTLDAVADITAVCYLMRALHPDRVVCSPIHVGSGHVHCAHGTLPVPAPATAFILRGIPSYGGMVRGELCTPTGAALLKYFVTSYAPMPLMRTQKIGYGMGHKTFESPNCVRAFLGDAESSQEEGEDRIVELSCNLDDMTPEALGFAQEQLWEAGAVEVFTTPIVMKKSRSAFMLTVHAPLALKSNILSLLFKHTTTLGVRETLYRRYTLERHIETRSTPYGEIHIKHASGYGVDRMKCEYEDLARIARAHACSIEEVKKELDI